MKKILFLLLFVLCASFATAQQTLKFGNVTLSDTASGSLNLKSGGLYSDFISSKGNISLYNDSGEELIIQGSNNGMIIFLNENLLYMDQEGIVMFIPLYPPQFSTSEINGLLVNNGAMVLNSDTGEIWVYLQDQWKILDTK